ncbi:MAG: nosD, partial [Pyrobaculum sp.]
MVLRGLFLLIGIAAVSALGAEVVINTPGYYRGVVADRLVINASGVWLEDVTVRGGYREVPLPQTMTAYRVKPAVGCLVVAGRNVTITNLRLDCAAGLLIFNSSGVVVRGFEARGP